MRYPPDHKSETRAKLVHAGAAVAKVQGFAATGVDALARAAGLTSGAFYKHFDGKEALLTAICDEELGATRSRFASIAPGDLDQILRAVDAYLSFTHVQSPAVGCLLPALSAEVGRAAQPTREAFERAFAELVTVIEEKIGDRAVGTAIIAQCVGAIMLARALATEAAQRELLRATRRGIRRMLGIAAPPEKRGS